MSKKSWKRYASIVCAATLLAWSPGVPSAQAQGETALAGIGGHHLVVPMQAVSSWESNVKKGLDDFVAMYGSSSPTYTEQAKPYAVFDFDNTTAILDIEEQLAIWQLDHLAFAIPPEKMEEVLLTGIPADKQDAVYGAEDGDGVKVRITDVIHDAARAYSVLHQQGWVTLAGKAPTAEVQASPEYHEFKAKMRWLYTAIGDTMNSSVSYPWVTYWFTGMTPQEVYDLAKSSHLYYSDPFKGQTWRKEHYTSPKDLKSAAGPVSISYKNGLAVTEEMRAFYEALNRNGIDVWVNSASQIDVVRAAVDAFRLQGVDGVVAMTNKLDKNGRYSNEYNYDFHPQTQGEGKAITIDKVIAPKYAGQGPILAAMDSQGDFNFATAYKNTKLVLVFNRQRSDDAAIAAGIAEWQKKHHIDLAKANKNGDSLFLLQGRNENTGTYWNSDQTLLLGKETPSYLSTRALKVEQELNLGKSIEEAIRDNVKAEGYTGYKSR